jgi:hypothetical protein
MTKIGTLALLLVLAGGSQACTVVMVERPAPVVAVHPARTSSGQRAIRVHHRPARPYAIATWTRPAPRPARPAPSRYRSAPGPTPGR